MRKERTQAPSFRRDMFSSKEPDVHSRLISRACLAQSTASGLFIDQSKKSLRSRARLAHWTALAAVLLVSAPGKTSARDLVNTCCLSFAQHILSSLEN